MRKSILLLTILSCFVGPAIAESNTTLYGRLTMGYGASNGGRFEGAPGKKGKFQQMENGVTGSRWGIKGSEDLSNDMKAYFKLEAALGPETGVDYGFKRDAHVGLSTPFGTLQLGRQPTVTYNILAPFNYTGNSTYACAMCNVMVSSNQRAARYNSGLVYFAPKWNGLALQASFQSKNDEAETAVPNLGDKNIFSLGARYDLGKFSAGMAYETKPVSDPGVSSSLGLAVEYKFGDVRVDVGYTDNHYKVDGKGPYIEVSMPINSFTVGAQLAYNHDATSPVDNEKLNPIAVGLWGFYNMSKTTRLYSLLGYLDGDAKEFANASRRYTYTFGIEHTF